MQKISNLGTMHKETFQFFPLAAYYYLNRPTAIHAKLAESEIFILKSNSALSLNVRKPLELNKQPETVNHGTTPISFQLYYPEIHYNRGIPIIPRDRRVPR